ncbi:MAG TPA: polyprenol phosphomannose-dependent alpha 1,6 mannosyltransferase MptB [Acidimicrobiales bacterium]|nr:polyprenol phosphomannose-dependent alpha 1,6 mannosyltransferase MptB [Acidimicrobiales bacterium]
MKTADSLPLSPVSTEPGTFRTWAVVGCAGSLGLALTGTRVGSIPDPGHMLWWFAVPDAGDVVLGLLFYLSVTLLVIAWLGVGQRARSGALTTKQAWLLLGLWAIPLALGPPLFSRDLYSYMGQGLVAHSGLDPYAVGPAVLGPGHVLGSIASVWRKTPAPYGPLFVAGTRGIAALFGRAITAEVVALRVLELLGVAMVMRYLPRLARTIGVDAGTALWLGVLSPLALFSFVASGHNDALMLGLLVAGLALAAEGRLVLALVLCGLATAVKLPAAVAVVFIAASRLRPRQGRQRLSTLATVVGVPAATVALVTWASGFGWTWLSLGALHVPADLRVLPTPSVAVGNMFTAVLHVVRIHVRQDTVVRVTQVVLGVLALAVVAWLVLQVRTTNVVRLTGLALMVVVLAGPTVWPWYLLWGLLPLAATPAQRSKVLAAAAALGMLVVGPSGTPILQGGLYIVVVLGCAVGCAWLVRGRRWHGIVTADVV